MGKRIASKIKKLLSPAASGGLSPKSRDDVDVREEYANAFRTESYNQFWTRVTQLNHKDSATCTPTESTTSARLMSYRLFTESLLDPDQVTVTRVIELVSIQRSVRTLLANYFSETASASFLCSVLLRDINRARFKYEFLRTVIESVESPKILSEVSSEALINQLLKVSRSINMFVLSSSSISRIQIIQSHCSKLLNRLESSKDKTRARFKLISWLKHGFGTLIMALTISLLVIIASHAFALLIAVPSLLTIRFGPVGLTKRLMRESAQLDVAAKGTYILSRDLDTISRLANRLNDELEHVRTMAKFWAERGLDRIPAGEEVARQLKRSDESFVEQLDELEEHLYLCFMTINRARNLVVKEILDPDRTGCPLGPKFK